MAWTPILAIACAVSGGATLFAIACVVSGARYQRAQDKAWREFGRTRPLLVSRDVGEPLHAARSTPVRLKSVPGKRARISGGRP